ncbi:transglycosylase SLT domain-containing protein [Advenella sp. RU8]|uniref:transglycosylase SLT domain-containing protein n=1 Tax=Advenella sp. RU8 TaxID=3399575 RepID=UPI003AAB100B
MALFDISPQARQVRQGIVSFFHDFIRLMVMYLGIAAMVLVAAIFILPAAQDRFQQVRLAVLDALEPDNSMVSEQDFLSLFAVNDQYERSRQDVSTEIVSGEEAATEKGFFANLTIDQPQFSLPGVPAHEAQLLRDYIARKFKVARNVTGSLILTVYENAREKDLDPLLVLGVIAVESRYNPFAESHVGAQGLMQVLTRVHAEKFDEFYGGKLSALNPVANVRVGTRILRDCIKRRGSVDGGLACYVGATGPNGGSGYAARVQAERQRIALESGIPLGKNLGQFY